jgi:hypothetical protein
MATVRGEVRFYRVVEKWHALARQRLAYIRELERSADGNTIARRNSSPANSMKSSALPQFGPRLPVAHPLLLPTQICGLPRNSVSRRLRIDVGAIIAYLKSIQQR